MATRVRSVFRNSVSAQLCFAGACMIAGTAGCSVFGASAEKAFSLSVSAVGINSLQIDWKNGSVTVRVDETQNEITAVGKKVVRAGSETRRAEALESLRVAFRKIDVDPTTLVLGVELTRNQLGTMFGGDVVVVLPAMLALNVEIGNGKVFLNGNAATSTVNLANGTVEIMGQSGDTTVHVKRGTIKVDSQAGTVDVACGMGEIDVTAHLRERDRLTARLGMGVIDLHVPVDTAAYLDLRTGLGAVDASLSDFKVTNRNARLTSVTATINGGGAHIAAYVGIGSVDFGRD